MHGPVVIGFDGSPSSEHALRTAHALVNATGAVIVTVWEPALATLPLAGEGVIGIDMPLDPQSAELLDDVSTKRSAEIAAAGVRLALEVGFADAAAQTMPDALSVAETLAQVARERGACAIVTGSHGHGALRTRLVGSTSTRLLSHAPCPVVVVPAAQPA